MKGRNSLRLNQATMNEALELYLNSERDGDDLLVEKVSADGNAGNFQVVVLSPESPVDEGAAHAKAN